MTISRSGLLFGPHCILYMLTDWLTESWKFDDFDVRKS